MTTLYHSSNEILAAINDSGLFGGVFASCNAASALSHAANLHIIELDDSEILTQQELNYHVDYAVVQKIVADATDCAEEDLARACELVIEDAMANDDDAPIFNAEDAAYASWEAQRIRGVIARKLGYKAIEMSDEHGTSYLVLSSATITKV